MNGRNVIGVCIGGILALAAADAARAQLFACKGEDGRSRYVSSAEQCDSAYKKLPSSYREKKPAKPAKKSPANTSGSAAAPGRLPNVSPRKQTALDKKRGEILLYELRSEENIYGALETLIAAADNDSRRQRLLKRRGEHARNIAAIRRELARLGYDGAPR